MARVVILLLDSLGVGASLDAKAYGDQGADTFGHVVLASQSRAKPANRPDATLYIPTLARLGLYHAALASSGKPLPGSSLEIMPEGLYGYGVELSVGKDTPSGHWELMGVPVLEAWGLFASFPPELITELCATAHLPGVLGNCRASGMAVMAEYGAEHIASGKPIIYTSADSVLQIAAHESTFGLEALYRLCEVARNIADRYRIGRVIARPFSGEIGHFKRTSHRRDYTMPPPQTTLLDHALAHGLAVHAVGKTSDIFAGRGISKSYSACDLEGLFAQTACALHAIEGSGIVFTNFVDFDSEYGHRRDPLGYATALEQLDEWLAKFRLSLRADDVLVITADHGCDPTFAGSDHTREHIPILVSGQLIQPRFIGRRESFADVGQSIASYLALPPLDHGCTFLPTQRRYTYDRASLAHCAT